MNTPPPSSSAPFTVLADLNPFTGEPSRFAAPNSTTAAQITEQLLIRDPCCRARWGPTTSPDQQPWPVPVFVRHQTAFDDPAGEVHIALLAEGETVGAELSTCCGTLIPQLVAEFTQHGPACPQCLTYWHIAYGHPPPDEDTDGVHKDRWATVDHELLSRLLTALRRLPTDRNDEPGKRRTNPASAHADTTPRTDNG